MLPEEPLEGEVGHPKPPGPQIRLADTLIRARESVLNQWAGIRPSLVINGGLPELDVTAPDDLVAGLNQTLAELQTSVMDDTGSRIDYAALEDSPAYAVYREERLSGLRFFKPEQLRNLSARRAFWINLYNALVLDAVINFGVQRSVIEGWLGMLTFFRRAAYWVDGQRISLEDIEHGILRANRGNPYLPGNHFPSDDPRLKWSLPLDPRLHFALNCGGRSCPPIRFYSANKLDDQLTLATRAFVAATVEIEPDKRKLVISRIFQWYRQDFGGRNGVIDFLIHYLPEDERRDFLIKARNRLRLQYTAYDWGLNSA